MPCLGIFKALKLTFCKTIMYFGVILVEEFQIFELINYYSIIGVPREKIANDCLVFNFVVCTTQKYIFFLRQPLIACVNFLFFLEVKGKTQKET